MHETKDMTIIGGGPTGLFASFYAGMRGATAQIVDTLPQLGGQLTALYPEKYIFDVGGYRQILAKDLVNALAEQAGQFNFPSFLNQHVTGLEQEDGHFVLVTDTDLNVAEYAVCLQERRRVALVRAFMDEATNVAALR